MKRRSWLWFAISAILAVLAGVLAVTVLRIAIEQGPREEAVPKQAVVVANQAIAAGTILGADNLRVEEREDIRSGSAVRVPDVLGRRTLRPIALGEIILMQDLEPWPIGEELSGTLRYTYQLEEDRIAVALPADDILSKWGAVLPGDHVDVLFTLDIVLETPMRPEDFIPTDEGEIFVGVERDQSLDQVSVLALQNLEVVQILEEPQPEIPDEDLEGSPEPPQRALVLKLTPQDAAILKYLENSVSKIDVALRSPLNSTLFNVEAVNINYLVLRYGISLPQPLE
jgi:Flp pilus assembly protein CpaB